MPPKRRVAAEESEENTIQGTSGGNRGEFSGQRVYVRFNLKEIQSILPKFDPSDPTGNTAREWLHKVEVKSRLYQWDQHQKLTYAVMCLEGPAREWYEMNLEEINDWDVFRDLLMKYYPDDVDVAGILTQLGNKKRSATQSIDDYFNEVVKACKRAKLDEKGIKQYLIQGIEEEVIKMQLLPQMEKPLYDFLQLMRMLDGGRTQKVEDKKGESSKATEQDKDVLDHREREKQRPDIADNINHEENCVDLEEEWTSEDGSDETEGENSSMSEQEDTTGHETEESCSNDTE
ncbi:uncharacterized protein LOC129795673 [Lutzomyia longipalpis]|nr:uncharacterized protein LOC129795673 [Lutzomyia longipalpis]